MAVKIILRDANVYSPTGHGLTIEGAPNAPIVPIAAIRAAFDGAAGNKVWAIKIVRCFTNLGLKESKDLVDFYCCLRDLAKDC